MMMPGWQEMIIIMIVVLFVFGAKRLPEMGKSLGLGIREFKKSLTTDLDDEPETKEPKKEAIQESKPETKTE
ncbi:MAG: twin-arginine translocase TatA/TatE family subunit [bacterium]|jgi:sec-independent protein translocase protein TatA|nr:twin-arginine translocase TatA/TatE family subunit [bacterium]